MKHEEFNKHLDNIIDRITKVLASKNVEYATEDDKLHNFKRAGKMLQCSPEKALIGMYTKHAVSILDIVDNLEKKCGTKSNCFPSFIPDLYIKILEEKIGDAINYMILLEALIKERRGKIND